MFNVYIMDIRTRLKKIIDGGNISHAYILEGDSLSGKEELGRWFLSEISGVSTLENCQDYYEVRASQAKGRSTSSIRDEDMEELQSNLKMKPVGERNLALIADADKMTIRAQNRFLKTLEEPSAGTVIVLLSENAENLLETVRSRCVIFRLYGEGDEGEASSSYSEVIHAIMEKRSFHEIKKLLTSQVRTRDDAYAFLDEIEHAYRDAVIGISGVDIAIEEGIRAIELIEETRRSLMGNASVRYSTRALALKIQSRNRI